MKTFIFSVLTAALLSGFSYNSVFAQSAEKPFAVAKVKVIDLKVTGMTCQGCADHITDILSKKEGIVKSDVIFSENSAHVTYDPKTVSEEDIIRMVEESGFKSEVKSEKNKKKIEKR